MEQEKVPLTALDQMVSDERSQLLKAAVPYLPARGQRFVSVYTKVLELAQTVAMFSASPQDMQICALPAKADPGQMLHDIRDFTYGESRRRLDKITEIIEMMQLVSMMQTDPKGDDRSYGSGLEE